MPRWRLRPAHGWSDFATELVIVVLGVLIALGAQQAIDAWQTRREVANFRDALRTELADTLAAYRGRLAQSRCVADKLARLEIWQRDWRDGEGLPMAAPIGRPLAYGLSTSVWQTGAGSIAGRIPLKERLAFAALYDDIENYDRLRLRERDVWLDLYKFDAAARLTSPEVNALRGLILAARTIDESMRYNWQSFREQAAALGIKPSPRATPPNTNGLCTPLRIEDAR